MTISDLPPPPREVDHLEAQRARRIGRVAERLTTLAAALERRDFARVGTISAALARGASVVAYALPGALHLALVALVVALEGLARELVGRAEADARSARVAATSDAAREVARAMREIGSLDVEARIYEQMITSAARVLTQQGDRLPEPTGYVHRSGHSEHLRGAAVCDVMGGGQWSRG